jgi:tRNA pseudouridine55 synthase
LVGTFLQRPPAYSAKKIGGRRSYALARAGARAGEGAPVVAPAPVQVTLWKVDAPAYDAGVLDLELECSAGFYVRALARDLGERLGTGAHLEALRRTRSGSSTLAQARRLEDIERDRAAALDALIPMSQLLPALPAVVLTEAAVERVRHGQALGPQDWTPSAVSPLATDSPVPAPEPGAAVRVFTPAGALAAVARTTMQRGVLHPSVVLM